MMVRRMVLLACVMGVMTIPAASSRAQGDDTACNALVEETLVLVNDACASLGLSEACYGHTRVDATFWQPREELVFSVPADRIPLLDLHRLATAPLDLDSGQWGVALLRAQANVPEALPGQAITFLLMGDATLENAISPEEAPPPVTPVTATVSASANLRSHPTTSANVVNSAAAGDELLLVGVNTAGDWYQVALDGGGTAWIWGELVRADDLDALAVLPVTEGEGVTTRYGPMQAFYFRTGHALALTCAQAPNALVVQTPDNVELALNINGLALTLGSTVVFSMAEVPTETGTTTALVVVLLQGHLRAEVNGVLVELEQPTFAAARAFHAFAVTLNAEGLVDADSHLVEPPPDILAPVVEYSCQSAVLSDLFRNLDRLACDTQVVYFTPPAPTWVPASDGGDVTHVGVYYNVNVGHVCPTLSGSTTVRLGSGSGCFASEAEARAMCAAISHHVTIDGQPGPEFSRVDIGIQGETSGCPPEMQGMTLWNCSWQTGAITVAPGPHQLSFWSEDPRGDLSMACTYTAR